MKAPSIPGARWEAFQQLMMRWPAGLRHGLTLALLAGMMGLGTWVVYVTGGTRYAYPYLMLVPVLMGAAFYGIRGALASAALAGGLMAAMPMDVVAEQPQSSLNWLIRLGLYLVIGGVAGSLFSLLNRMHLHSERMARIDPRTGLANQVALEEALAQLLAQRWPQHEFGLILVRITDISDVLEALGPEAADLLALATAQRLQYEDSAIVDVFRFSNAELFLLVEKVDESGIRRIADRLTEVGEENLLIQGVPLRVQLALGSRLRDAADVRPESLILDCRIAMLAAIEKHRSHCHFSPELTQHKLETVKLISKVRRDLDRGKFELHFQPKLRLSDGRVSGCEGLIRWRDESGALIPPGMFMPKVENTTLIEPVTRFVAERACQFASTHTGFVSINLSVRNLQDEHLLDAMKALVESYAIEPARLEVEITESALMSDMVAARKALERLRCFGVKVSIDDFGTGFSSFEYLQHLPITGLKIDRAFVKGIGDDPRAKRLLACLIDVGHTLDLEVTAEGVETLEQHWALCQLGCDQAQGFVYAKALPPGEYTAWHDQHRSDQWA
ncbi:putative bifunctional diguanylate cyclase/phosphodiesterase [Halomonas urumqiensis]|nr:GGDEF domain-containing phosphodiesterase [Halomonas urumqiensis]